MAKLYCVLAAITLFAAPVTEPEPDPEQPIKGLKAECGPPPAMPGTSLGCMHRPSDDTAACVFAVGTMTDSVGIRWRLVMTIGQPGCNEPWIAVKLEGFPAGPQQLSRGREL